METQLGQTAGTPRRSYSKAQIWAHQYWSPTNIAIQAVCRCGPMSASRHALPVAITSSWNCVRGEGWRRTRGRLFHYVRVDTNPIRPQAINLRSSIVVGRSSHLPTIACHFHKTLFIEALSLSYVVQVKTKELLHTNQYWFIF